MRHVYECPMRWADLDQLGHVNNVVYVDYLQEARVDLMRTMLPRWRADLTEGVVVVQHAVTYLASLELRSRPVSVEVWVTEVRAATFTLAYEVFDSHDDDTRRVYVRATTVLAPYDFIGERPRRISAEERSALQAYAEPADSSTRAPVRPVDRTRASRWPLHVRFSDVDAYRHVNNVTYFEYLQESRIKMMADLRRGHDLPESHLVVAQTDVDYLGPILLRHEPYQVWSEVVRLGGRSMTVESEIADGDRTLARGRVVVVFYDTCTHRSADPDPGLRGVLEAVVRPA